MINEFFFKACPAGFHGHRCQHACNCHGKAQCDARTGQCLCPAGYQGEHCEKGKEQFSLFSLTLCRSHEPLFFLLFFFQTVNRALLDLTVLMYVTVMESHHVTL